MGTWVGASEARVVAAVRAAVVAHEARDAREARSRRLMVAVLDTLPHPFDRHAAATHLTASAIVAGPRGTVLHVHKRMRAWLQPGGHVDPGEGPWDTVLRETVEETGLVVRHPAGGPRLLHLDAHRAGPHMHLDLRYLLEADDGEPAPAPGESPEVRWFGWDEALRVTDGSCRTALRWAR